MKFDISLFFENVSRKVKLRYNMIRTTGTLHADLSTFMIILRLILLRMRKFQTKLIYFFF